MQNYLITGATGFLGGILSEYLSEEDFIISIGRSEENKIICDLSNNIPVIKERPDIVIHAAGKAHSTPRTEEEIQEFYNINVGGTQNLLQALEGNLPEVFVFISTVAVYGREKGEGIDETHPLKGSSPYALSKIEAENLILEWGKNNNVSVLIFRLPLIAGSNPPGNLGKMISGIRSGKYLSIAGGKAKRSVVMAEDIARCIKDNIGKSGVYNLTDGYHPTFREIESVICKQLNKSLPVSIPLLAAKFIGKTGDFLSFLPVNSDTIGKMTSDLTFDDSKARRELNWKPRKVTDHFKVTD